MKPFSTPPTAHDKPLPGFSHSRAQFEALVDSALAHAKRLGASDAAAQASEGCGLSVSVRKGELENVERNRDKSLGITVYVGHRRGNASTSDFSEAAIERTVKAAHDIARFTAQDPMAELPQESLIAHDQRDLDLFHPWAISSEEAATLALRCEAAALQTDAGITNSEGAAVSAQQSHFFSAHTHGFRGGYASSRHSVSVAPIAGTGDDMQRITHFENVMYGHANQFLKRTFEQLLYPVVHFVGHRLHQIAAIAEQYVIDAVMRVDT